MFHSHFNPQVVCPTFSIVDSRHPIRLQNYNAILQSNCHMVLHALLEGTVTSMTVKDAKNSFKCVGLYDQQISSDNLRLLTIDFN